MLLDRMNMRTDSQSWMSRRGFLASIATAVVLGASFCAPPAARATSTATANASAEPCHTTTKVCVPRTLDEVWLVSTRCLGCPSCESTPPNFEVWRLDCEANRWDASSLDAFLKAQQPNMPTDIYVHGNRTEAGEAQSQGLSVYHQLTAGVSGDKPIRFVIFSWPSSPIRGLKEDARVKAARTNSDGYYLGWLVNKIDPRVSVNLIGYSFGARIVTGALQLIGGGPLMGRVLPEKVEKRAPMQAVLIAAAVNNDWLAIGRPHGEALNAVDGMLALNNYCDRALKHYSVIDPCSRPSALGYTGAYGPLGDNAAKLEQHNMCCAVGKEHEWRNYWYNPSIVAMIRPFVGLGE
jgi:hypothetical protein